MATQAQHLSCAMCADCPGFVKHDESFGSEKNVAHFQKLLQGFGNLVKDTTSAAWWLVKQSPQVRIKSVMCLLL